MTRHKIISVFIACISVIIIGISIFFRFYHLNVGSYWFDELVSVQYAKRPLIDSLVGSYYDPGKSPFHTLILGLWVRVFGSSETATRSCFGIINVLSILFFYYFASKLIKKRSIALLGTALFAICWLHIWAAREARYYSLLLLFGVISTGMFLSGIRSQRDRIIFIVVSTLGLYTHVVFSILILGEFIVDRLFHESKQKIIVFFLPFILYLPYISQMIYFIRNPNSTNYNNTASQISDLLNRQPMSPRVVANIFLLNAPTLYVSIFIFGIFGLAIAWVRNVDEGLFRRESLALTVFLVVISLFPFINRLVTNDYYLYFLTPSCFYLFLLLVAKSNRWYTHSLSVVVVGMYLFFSLHYLPSYASYFNVWHYDKATEYLQSHTDTQAIIFDACDTLYMVQYYETKGMPPTYCLSDISLSTLKQNNVVFVGRRWSEKFWQEVRQYGVNNRIVPQKTTDYGTLIIRQYY